MNEGITLQLDEPFISRGLTRCGKDLRAATRGSDLAPLTSHQQLREVCDTIQASQILF